MTKRIKLKVGDLFLIKLDETNYALGIIMHISKSFKQSMIIGIFDKLVYSQSNIKPQELVEIPFYDHPNYTGTKILSEGDWQIIGHHPELLVNREIPLLAAGYSVYDKDEVVKYIDKHQLKNYVQLKGQGMYSIVSKLRDHFQLQEP